MNLEEKIQLEEALNHPSIRQRVVVFNPSKLKLLKTLHQYLDDGQPSPIILKTIDVLRDNVADSEKEQIKEMRQTYNLQVSSSRATPKDLKKFMFDVKRRIAEEELKFLYANNKSSEDVQVFLASKSTSEKTNLLESLVMDYHNNNHSDVAFLRINSVLAHFNLKIKREVVDIVGENNITTSENENQTLRCIAAGKFFLPFNEENNEEDFSKYSKAFMDYENKNLKLGKYNASDYDLFEHNHLFNFGKESSNLQTIAPNVTKALIALGIPPESAYEFNSYDFAKILGRITKEKSPLFKTINPTCEDSPFQNFCKTIASDEKLCHAIRDDFIKHEITPSSVDVWLKNMKTNGDYNPSLLDSKNKIKITIHHKNYINYAANLASPLMINDLQNLSLTAQFGHEDAHHIEHIGDNRNKLYINQKKQGRNDPCLLPTSSLSQGAIAVSERFAFLNENAEDTRVYISPTLTLSSKLHGNHDFVKTPISLHHIRRKEGACL